MVNLPLVATPRQCTRVLSPLLKRNDPETSQLTISAPIRKHGRQRVCDVGAQVRREGMDLCAFRVELSFDRRPDRTPTPSLHLE